MEGYAPTLAQWFVSRTLLDVVISADGWGAWIYCRPIGYLHFLADDRHVATQVVEPGQAHTKTLHQISKLGLLYVSKYVHLLRDLEVRSYTPQLNIIHSHTLLLTDGNSVPPTASARNLGFIFDYHLSSPITSLLSLVHVSTTSVIFVTYALFLTSIRLEPSAHLLFTPDLTTVILCRLLLFSSNAVKPPVAYPKWSFSCCCWTCCSSQVLQFWPYSLVSALAQSTGTHWIQVSLFPPRISSSSLLLHVSARSHHSPAFLIDVMSKSLI